MPLERGYLVGCQAEGGKFLVGTFFGGGLGGLCGFVGFGGGSARVDGGGFGGCRVTHKVVDLDFVCHIVLTVRIAINADSTACENIVINTKSCMAHYLGLLNSAVPIERNI